MKSRSEIRRQGTSSRFFSVIVVVAAFFLWLLPRESMSQEADALAEPIERALDTEALDPAPAVTSSTTTLAKTSPGTEVDLFFTSDLDGALVDVPCGQSKLSPILSQMATVVSEARSQGLQPVVIDVGDALYPSPLVNHLTKEGSRTSKLLDTLSKAGYDAFAIGDSTATGPSEQILKLLEAARKSGPPFLVSNIGCEEQEADCTGVILDHSRKNAMLERSGLKIGVVSFLSKNLSDSISSALLGDASVMDPIKSAAGQIRSLRQSGAGLVILISQLDTADSAPRHTLELISGLESDALPDVVLSGSTAHIVSQMQATTTGPPILTVESGAISHVILEKTEDRWIVSSQRVITQTQPDPAVEEILGSFRSDFCDQTNRPLDGATLASDLEREAFINLVLRVMQEQTGSEIAMINNSAVRESPIFPISERVTATEIYRALPFGEELRKAIIRGSDLADFISPVVASEEASVAGVEDRDGTIFVNGRPIDPDGRYRVVTTNTVARGGTGIIEDKSDDFRQVDPFESLSSDATLANRVIFWFEQRDEPEPYDPEQEIDLGRRPLWFGAFNLDAGVSYANIVDDNSDAEGNRRYSQTQLNRQGVLDLRASAEARGGLSVVGHLWENQLRLSYGRQRLETEVGSDEYDWAESVDLVQFRSAYDLDYIRDVALSGDWYGPSFFIEYQLESEFYHETTGEDDQSNHFLEMTGLLGVKIKPFSWLRFSVAGGIRSVILDPDPFPVPGLNLRAEIVRRKFAALPRFPVYLSAIADYFVGWPVALPETDLVPAEGSAVHKFSGEVRLEFTLYGPLRFVGSVRGFIYDEQPGTVATAFDATAGLSVAISGHRQAF